MSAAAESLDQRFADAMGQLLGPDFPTDIALAVSGGGDSMAMLTLAHNWTRRWGVKLWVVTVDHALRPESADEARMVAEDCAALGHPHATLRWDWDGKGNVQAEARRARLALIDQWRGSLRHVLMAHTRDDLAETFLMRLKRGSGIDGLAAMRPARPVSRQPRVPGKLSGATPPHRQTGDTGFTILRPCLGMRRTELRHYLTTLKGRWVDDPSNEDHGYERVRMRSLLAELAPNGLGVDTIAKTAARMARSREVLQRRAAEVWDQIGQETRALDVPTGEIVFDRDGFFAIEPDTQRRLLAAALHYVASADYAPRADAVEQALDLLFSGGVTTLHGCELRCEKTQVHVFREYRAVRDRIEPADGETLWDDRWRVFPQDMRRLSVRALGDAGWQQIPVRTPGTPPHLTARSLPSLWDGNKLVACAAMGFGPTHAVQLLPMRQGVPDFRGFLLSH
ncbi:tRNA lysidine(34) synthetase TilS [Tropicibacter sp. S64]|uniref:tRNA lysidine(34) synthetase TilS n=1 Tax=Tropicibacter sp. S64 TaxID=3415122 RepID=UPI003C7DA0D9